MRLCLNRTPVVCLVAAAAALVLPGQTEKGSIPPNFGFYKLNPEYKGEPASYGWATERVEEKLGRGLVALRVSDSAVYLAWRLLKSDPATVAFNVYRSTGGGPPVRLNAKPVQRTTDYVDAHAPAGQEHSWWVCPIVNGRELEASHPVTLATGSPVRPYLAIRLRDDLPGSVDRIGIGDLDGDGEYDFVVKRPRGMVDPGTIRRSPDTFKIEAYRRDGAFLWRNDLGWSIELGIWYSPMIVWDLDGDGKAEVALKTGEGDPREPNGQVLSGPEYLSAWNGLTGAEIARVNWIPRGKPADWGDYTGNRMNRNMIGVAYLDGKTPSIVTFRGIYGLMRMETWFLRAGKLEKVWSWSNFTSGWKYQGQGQHSIHVADIDGDGRDEILNGSIAVDHDGRIMWSTGLGHGDRFYVSDIDPQRPGLEVFYIYEDPHPQNGVSLWDARTGDLIWGLREETQDNQVALGLCADIDPGLPGMECWADKYYFSARGKRLDPPVPPQGELVWWDADPLREFLFRGAISKWKGPELPPRIEGMPLAIADILGDWREEIITYYQGELRIYSTTIPARDRRVCLMQDPLYRSDVALRSMGYPHVPMTSYYLGAPAPSRAQFIKDRAK